MPRWASDFRCLFPQCLPSMHVSSRICRHLFCLLTTVPVGNTGNPLSSRRAPRLSTMGFSRATLAPGFSSRTSATFSSARACTTGLATSTTSAWSGHFLALYLLLLCPFASIFGHCRCLWRPSFVLEFCFLQRTRSSMLMASCCRQTPQLQRAVQTGRPHFYKRSSR